ncbi:hypothetical protein TNCV_1483551 [Trichonephila clavipes]|nr:hypothetical protein TNCV_1483551 [Trichonephila clavipes]
MKKRLQERHFVLSDDVKAASQDALREVDKNGFYLCISYTKTGRSVSSSNETTLQVDVLRCCELFRWLEHQTPDRKTWAGCPMPPNTRCPRVHTEGVFIKSMGPKVFWAVAAETTSARDWRIFPFSPVLSPNCGDGDRWCHYLSFVVGRTTIASRPYGAVSRRTAVKVANVDSPYCSRRCHAVHADTCRIANKFPS